MSHHASNDIDEQNLPQELQRLHDTLSRVGEDYRSTLPDPGKLIEQVYVVARELGPEQSKREDFVLETPLHSFPESSGRRRPHVERGWRRGLFAIAATLLIIVLAQLVLSHRLASPGSSSASTYTIDQIDEVSMDAPNDGWAIGSHEIDDVRSQTRAIQVTLRHYHDDTWTPSAIQGISPAPAGFIDTDFTLSMAASDNGWAFYNRINVKSGALLGVLLHYDGAAWRLIPGPAQDIWYTSMQMVSPHGGWLAGEDSTGAHLWHYDGQTWANQPITWPYSGQPAVLRIAMLTDQQGWAVGSALTPTASSSATTAIFRFESGQWTFVTALANVQATMLAPVSSKEVWLIGSPQSLSSTTTTPTPQTGQGSLYHYQGGHWTIAPMPSGPSLSQSSFLTYSAIQMLGENNGWIIGTEGGTNGALIILRYDGHIWQQTSAATIAGLPATAMMIKSLAFAAPDDGWAVGSLADGHHNTTALLLHYNGSAWTVYT